MCVCAASQSKKCTLRQSADGEVIPIYRYRYRYRKIDTDRCVCALPAATENIFPHKARVARWYLDIDIDMEG